MKAGAGVVWRCHVGLDTQNDHSRRGWEFLRRYLEDVPAFVFSCDHFAPPWVPRDRLHVIAPSIDPFSAKNEAMSPSEVRRSLQQVGLLAGGSGQPAATFRRRDGSLGRIRRPVDLLGTGPPPSTEVPIVLQASRWDALKDMSGVMVGFAENLAAMGSAHLVLAGPSVDGVADDPEASDGPGQLPHASGGRSPHDPPAGSTWPACRWTDGDEAAAVVNALQRHAAVVVQKSLAEGFGLTVVEAMWKARPVVGSAVGGIVHQIIPGETGHLLTDPHDLTAFADALVATAGRSRRGRPVGTQRPASRQRAVPRRPPPAAVGAGAHPAAGPAGLTVSPGPPKAGRTPAGRRGPRAARSRP